MISVERLIIFGDCRFLSAKMLTDRICALVRQRRDIVVALVIDTSRVERSTALRRVLLKFFYRAARKLFNHDFKVFSGRYVFVDLYDICKKHGIEVRRPSGGSVNSPEFVEFLKSSVKPTIALSVGCLEVFRGPLIETFELFVNFHNGILPYYKGLGATSWSLYLGEPMTGFTFHHVSGQIDGGNILLTDSVKVSDSLPLDELEYLKTQRAVGRVEELLEMMMRRERGTTQDGSGRYFGRDEREAIKAIENPSAVTVSELQRRLRAFSVLRVRLGNEYYPVTRLKPVQAGYEGRYSLPTQEGTFLKMSRCAYVPPGLYTAYRKIARLLH